MPAEPLWLFQPDPYGDPGTIRVTEPGPDGTPSEVELFPVPVAALALVAPGQTLGLTIQELADAAPEAQQHVMGAWFRVLGSGRIISRGRLMTSPNYRGNTTTRFGRRLNAHSGTRDARRCLPAVQRWHRNFRARHSFGSRSPLHRLKPAPGTPSAPSTNWKPLYDAADPAHPALAIIIRPGQ